MAGKPLRSQSQKAIIRRRRIVAVTIAVLVVAAAGVVAGWGVTRETGKKAAKATRKAGLVPCVLYGPHTEPVHFAVPTLSLRPLIHTTEQHRVTVNVGGDSLDAILKEVIFHPVTERPWHVDFQALTAGEMFTTTIPVELVGTG